jgi:deoxyribodipyrimidine photolyase-related protein
MKLIILPNQLFPLKMLPEDIDTIYLIEEPRYFTDFDFHKLKLVYHRASMKKYENELPKKFKCVYKEFDKVNNTLYSSLNKETTCYFNPIDHKLSSKFKKVLSKAKLIDNLNFLLTPQEIEDNKSIFYKKSVLVTGGTGLIGIQLVKKLFLAFERKHSI